jgi:predicted metal-dependent RNase
MVWRRLSEKLIALKESYKIKSKEISFNSNDYPYLTIPEADISKLSAIVLSHAHMDHCGLIPYIYEMGYDGPLYLTTPTRDLMVFTLHGLYRIDTEGR